jgi:hypothetical protein
MDRLTRVPLRGDIVMKLLLFVAALIASVALAAPAEAAAKKHKKAVHRTSVSRVHARPGVASDPYSVYVSGEYIGRDPDLNIRAYMTRNPHIWDGPD